MSKLMTRRTFVGILGGGALATAFASNSRSASSAAMSDFDAPVKIREKPKVVRAYDPKAVFWDYKSTEYLDFIRQEAVEEMVARGITGLTGERETGDAWKKLIPSYQPGDGVAIKPNFNAIHSGAEGLITCPQLIRAVIKGLVDAVGVDEADIYVYDLCKWIPESRVKNRIGYRINYVERRGDGIFKGRILPRLSWGLESADKSAVVNMSARLIDSDGDAVSCFMPKVITRCKHLINIALLSNHPFMAISGPLKNHFGTIRFSNYNSFPVVLHGEALQPSIVEINMNPHIRAKTRLVICDGLIGQFSRGEGGFAGKWETFPSKDGVPNSIFFATDPVAMESVLLHFVNRERDAKGLEIRSHDYLHAAARRGLGIHEDFEDISKVNEISYEVL